MDNTHSTTDIRVRSTGTWMGLATVLYAIPVVMRILFCNNKFTRNVQRERNTRGGIYLTATVVPFRHKLAAEQHTWMVAGRGIHVSQHIRHKRLCENEQHGSTVGRRDARISHAMDIDTYIWMYSLNSNEIKDSAIIK